MLLDYVVEVSGEFCLDLAHTISSNTLHSGCLTVIWSSFTMTTWRIFLDLVIER